MLDVVLGFEPTPPPPPTPLLLLAVWREAGLDAAIARFRQLDDEARASCQPFLRDCVFILEEAGCPLEAAEMLKLGQASAQDGEKQLG